LSAKEEKRKKPLESEGTERAAAEGTRGTEGAKDPEGAKGPEGVKEPEGPEGPEGTKGVEEAKDVDIEKEEREKVTIFKCQQKFTRRTNP